MTQYSKSLYDRHSQKVEGPQPALTVKDVFAFFRKRVVLIGTCMFIAAAISAWNVSGVSPVYSAGGQLLLGEQGRDNNNVELLEAQLLNNSVIEGELAILRSSTLLARVVEHLQLIDTPEFNPALRPVVEPTWIESITATTSDFIRGIVDIFLQDPPTSTVAEAPEAGDGDTEVELSPIQAAAMANPESQGPTGAAIRKLRRSVSVRQQGASFVVAVNANSSNPELAAALSNTLMREYISFTAEKRLNAAKQFANFLEQRVDELAATLEASEKEALAFRAVIESNADSSARLEQQMSELTSKLVDARAQLAEAEARSTRVAEITENEGVLAAADVLTSDTNALITIKNETDRA